MNDYISGINQQFNSFSSLFAPIIGALLYDNFEYNKTFDTMMIAEAVIFLIFLVFNCGINPF